MTIVKTLSLGLLFIGAALYCGADALDITNPQEFENFMNNPTAQTVYLKSNLDLNDITVTGISGFTGVFDGQGYTISNLNITSASANVGLFSESSGMTIRNLILDSTCTVTSTCAATECNVGTLVGKCESTGKECVIENFINMADVTYTGSSSGKVYTGGIVGSFVAAGTNGARIENVANYGNVTIEEIGSEVYVGGLAGKVTGSTSDASINVTIRSSANFGEVNNKGTSNKYGVSSLIGYVIGNFDLSYVIAYGEYKVATSTTDSVGLVFGQGSGPGEVKATSWYKKNADDFVYNGRVTSGSSSLNIDSIGNNAKTYDDKTPETINKAIGGKYWLANRDRKKVTFQVNNISAFIFDMEIVLTPVLIESEGRTFSYWFTDEVCQSRLGSAEVSNDITLHGGWSYTLTLNATGGDLDEAQKTRKVVFGHKYGGLPTTSKTGYTFLGWFTDVEDGSEVTEDNKLEVQDNVLIYAQWRINQYNLTFDLGNGTINRAVVDYNSQVNYPTGLYWEEHVFHGWDITGITNMPAHDLYIKARWTINNYTVTFNYNNGINISTVMDYGDNITYPKKEDMKKIGHTFVEWDNDIATVPAEDIIINAIWSINCYNLTFYFGNGTKLVDCVNYSDKIIYPDADSSARIGFRFIGWSSNLKTMPDHDVYIAGMYATLNYKVTFDYEGHGTNVVRVTKYGDIIEYPDKNPTKEGYAFVMWCTTDPEKDCNLTIAPARDVTLIPQWTKLTIVPFSSSSCSYSSSSHEVASEYVEIVFEKKGMTKKDVEDLVKRLTDEHFEIIEFEEDKGTGEVKVIIKFTGPESSKDFVWNVNNYTRDNPNIIKRVKAMDIKDVSYAEHNASYFWHTLLTSVVLLLIY